MRNLTITISVVILTFFSLLLCSCENWGESIRKVPNTLAFTISYSSEIAHFDEYKNELFHLLTLDDGDIKNINLSEDRKTLSIGIYCRNKHVAKDMKEHFTKFPDLFSKIYHDNKKIFKNEMLIISGALKGQTVSYKDRVYNTSKAKIFIEQENEKVQGIYQNFYSKTLFIPAEESNQDLVKLKDPVICFSEGSYLKKYHDSIKFDKNGNITIPLDRTAHSHEFDIDKFGRSYNTALEAFLSYQNIFTDIESFSIAGMLTSKSTFHPDGSVKTVNNFSTNKPHITTEDTPLNTSPDHLGARARLTYFPTLSNVIATAAMGNVSNAKMGVPGSLIISPNLLNVGFLKARKLSRYSEEVDLGLTLNNKDYSFHHADSYLDPVFSPDSRKAAYALGTANGMYIVTQAGFQSIPYEEIFGIYFSHDASTLAFIAKKSSGLTLVTNNRESKHLFDDIMTPFFSDDDSLLAFAGKLNEQWALYINGEQKGQPYRQIHNYTFLPNSHKLVLFADGTAYLDDKILPGLKGMTFSSFSALQTSKDGEHLAFMAIKEKSNYLYYDGKLTKIRGEIIDSLSLSDDGLHLAYGSKVDDSFFYTIDGQQFGPYEALKYQGFNFSPDSQHFAFNAIISGAWVSVIDGTVGPSYAEMPHGGPMFSPDSQHIVYFGKKDGSWCIIKDAQEFFISEKPFSTGSKILRFDDRENFHYISRYDKDIFLNRSAFHYIRPTRLDRFDSLLTDPIKSLPEFFRLYVTAATGPDAWGHYCIAMMYFSGDPVPQDYPEAYSHLEKAMKQELPIALAKRGNMYLTGDYSTIDYERAYQISMPAAKRGNPEAIFNIGQLYQHGGRVKQDKPLAYAHYQIYLEILNSLSIEDALVDKYTQLLAAQLSAEEHKKALSHIPRLKEKYSVGKNND